MELQNADITWKKNIFVLWNLFSLHVNVQSLIGHVFDFFVDGNCLDMCIPKTLSLY